MLLNCANPNCPAEFLYLYEAEWIMIALPDRTVQRYWLCGACAPSMRVVYDPAEGVHVIRRHEVKKSADSRADQSSRPKAA
jgi:hypothetical protein